MPIELPDKSANASAAVGGILILGGTGEALKLAAMLSKADRPVIYSLAGVTENPVLPPCEVRRGGFGGLQGLVAYLRQAKIQVLIDATHPFAVSMSQHASAAAKELGLLLVRLEQLAWQPCENDNWMCVANMEMAVAAIPENARVLVTTGRKNISALLARSDLSGVIRSIEPLLENLPVQWRSIIDRPPFTKEYEMEIMRRHDISHLLSKNAGGTATAAKLAAARDFGIAVVMINRPAKPECPTFASTADILAALHGLP
jgi:precorrin-6A/cobalt-precorrin-6A reductase